MNLCTLEEVKQFLNIDKEDTSKDLILKLYMEGITEIIEGEIGRDILAKDYVEKYPGTNSNSLILKQYPINSINSIKYICNGSIEKSLEEHEYDINTKAGILYRDLAWWQVGSSNLMSGRINFPQRYIRVEYNAGYKEIPGDLKLLLLQLLKEQMGLDNSEAVNKGLRSYSISDVKLEWKSNIRLSEMQLATIKKYRSIRI
ncbi:head-tail connector protein [Clostridium haemolyticum]|uniref:Uncharacterized protein n=1 Tax=Clostridium haemolyticum NCTC 9693 TaxID=1443114 RepID=A0ABR4TGV8_CLOHA|nr:head-tail connector protein [Clostridium haemolyticum]KEI18256.1 hypothetical protein Z960_03820 [Clostridium haemolyticum NCTC 9693]KGN04179.1 hypothetical protein Z961_04310 [Clostridium haemolyticum NCTC 8350]